MLRNNIKEKDCETVLVLSQSLQRIIPTSRYQRKHEELLWVGMINYVGLISTYEFIILFCNKQHIESTSTVIGAFFMEGHMAKIGVGNVLASAAQSAGWKALNQLINFNSRFGIFDKNGNAFYETGLSSDDQKGLAQYFKVLSVDSPTESGVTALNYNKNYNVTTAPVENSQKKTGQTMPYNLVEQPRQGQITYVSTGTEKQRRVFEEALEKAQSEFVLYELHTAERTMKDIKITGYSVNRSSSQGAQMIQYQITFQQVFVVKNTLELSGATSTYNDSKSQGALATSSPTGSQEQAASKTQ